MKIQSLTDRTFKRTGGLWLAIATICAVFFLSKSTGMAVEYILRPAFPPSIPSSANGDVNYQYIFGAQCGRDGSCDLGGFGLWVDGGTHEQTTINGAEWGHGDYESWGFAADTCDPAWSMHYYTGLESETNNNITAGSFYGWDISHSKDGTTTITYITQNPYAGPQLPSCPLTTNHFEGRDGSGNLVWTLDYVHLATPCWFFDSTHCDCGGGVTAWPMQFCNDSYYEIDVWVKQGATPPVLSDLGVPSGASSGSAGQGPAAGSSGSGVPPGFPPPGTLPVPPGLTFPVGGPLWGRVAAGSFHSLGVEPDGTVRAWGQNIYGQIGDGTTNQRNAPVQVPGLSGITMAAAGEYHSMALASDGTIWSWGLNTSYQIGGPSTGYSTSYFTNPVHVYVASGVMTNVTYIAAGTLTSYAVRGDGTVWAWGANGSGQLGNGSSGSSVPLPAPVTNLTGVVAVAGGNAHALALTANGTVYAWGNNSNGQLGNGTTTSSLTPILITNLSNIVAISSTAWSSSSYALDSSGTVWVWGKNASGQLGLGTTTDVHSPVAITSLSGTNIVGIAAGGSFCLALASDGTLWAWGNNASGELGDGTTTSRTSPVAVSLPGGSQALGVAAGFVHTLSIQADGTVLSWGANTYGQLGRSTTGNSPTPGTVTGF